MALRRLWVQVPSGPQDLTEVRPLILFMQEKKIVVIGVGGRTGTMFAFELGKVADVLGVGKEIEQIKKEKLFVKRKERAPLVFREQVITASQFPDKTAPEIIFLATKNPVGPALKHYYQKIKERRLPPPTLVLSQNGIAAIKDSLKTLKEVFGKDSDKVRVARLVLFNPIDRKEIKGSTDIIYSLPIRVAFGKISGPGNLQNITFLFKKSRFVTKEFLPEEIQDMEFSKLFLNLMGMASATRELSVSQGFQNPETLEEEIGVLKEYIRVVQASGGKFLNFPWCPVKFITFFIKVLPIKIFLPLRKYLSRLISEGREGKPKDLAEIKYYNGAVVNLGKKIGISTPINQKVLGRALK